MFSKQRISLFIIVLGLLIVIGAGLKAHFIHDVETPDLSFTSNPDISCNIDGWTFTHTRTIDYDGSILTDWWYRVPSDPVVSIEAEAHGFGWAHILFYGNIDGNAHGDTQNPTSEQLGSWIGFLPFSVDIDHEIGALFPDVSFNRTPKEYSWDASGSIKLVPVYWKWSLAIVIPTGSWEEASSDFHRTQTDSAGGTWEVNRNWTTMKKIVLDSDSGSTSTPSTLTPIPDPPESPQPPTVPDRPGSFSLSPGRISIRLSWTDSASDGGSAITAYEYQYQRSTGCSSWGSWSSWTSGGTDNFALIYGLTRNTKYAVRMRAVNSVGASSVTGQKIVRTQE